MPRNKLSDLNNHLFEVLEMLKEDEISTEKAKAIVDVASQIVEIKKVEVMQARTLLKAGYHAEVNGVFMNPETDLPAKSTKLIEKTEVS